MTHRENEKGKRGGIIRRERRMKGSSYNGGERRWGEVSVGMRDKYWCGGGGAVQRSNLQRYVICLAIRRGHCLGRVRRVWRRSSRRAFGVVGGRIRPQLQQSESCPARGVCPIALHCRRGFHAIFSNPFPLLLPPPTTPSLSHSQIKPFTIAR